MIWLDALRVFACFSVAAVHISLTFNIPGRIGQFMAAGSNGLGIFYILSGFLAYYSMERYKGNAGGWIGKKLLRILPMYYFALVVFVVFYEFILRSVPEDPNKIKWLSYFLGINTILKKGPVFWYNIGALSSMSIFLWFYCLVPLMRRIINNFNRSLIFLLAAYGMLRALQYTEYLTMFRAYYYFAIGITVYYAITEHKEKITMLLFAFVIMLLMLADSKGGLGYGLTVGIFIMSCVDLTIKNDFISKIIVFFSKRSFAIYIAHTAVMQIAGEYVENYNFKSFIIMFIATVAATAVLYEGIEVGFVKGYRTIMHRCVSVR